MFRIDRREENSIGTLHEIYPVSIKRQLKKLPFEKEKSKKGVIKFVVLSFQSADKGRFPFPFFGVDVGTEKEQGKAETI